MKGRSITLQAEIGLFRQSIAEIGQFFLEPDNLRFWLLVTLSGYAVGLFTWAIDTNPPMVEKYFLENLAQSGLRRAVTTHTVLVVLLFNIAWLTFSYMAARINHASMSYASDMSVVNTLRRVALTFLPSLMLFVPLVLSPTKFASTILFVELIIGIGAAMVIFRHFSCRSAVSPMRRSFLQFLPLYLFLLALILIPPAIVEKRFALYLLIIVLGTIVALQASVLFPCIRNVFITKPTICRVTVGALVVLYIITYSVWSISNYENLRFLWWDFGIEESNVWYVSTGDFSYPIVNYLGHHAHFSPVIYLVAILYLIRSDPRIVLIFQSVLIASGTLPLYWLAKSRLKSELAALAFSVAYLLFPAVGRTNGAEYHTLSLVISPLLYTYYCFHRRAWKGYAIFLLLSLMCRDDIALSGIGLGAYITLYEARYRKVGVATVLASAAWFGVTQFWLFPRFYGALSTHMMGRFSNLGHGLGEIVMTLVSNPVYVVRQILEPHKIHFLFDILVPAALLPLFSGSALIMAIPAFATQLLTGFPDQAAAGRYSAQLIPWVFICSIYGVQSLVKMIRLTNQRQVLAGLSMLLVVTSFASSEYLGPSLLDGASGIVKGRAAVCPHCEKLNIFKGLVSPDPDKTIATSLHLSTHFSHHKETESNIIWGSSGILNKDTDYILLDLSDTKFGYLDWGANEALMTLLQTGRYGLILLEDYYILLGKGYDTSRNPQAIWHLSTHKYFEAIFTGHWEGVANHHDADLAARGGTAKRGLATGAEGALVTGAYATLPPGVYRVHYWLRVNDNTLDKGVGAIDVIDRSRGEFILASRAIKCVDFVSTTEYQPFSLKMVIAEETPIEARVWFTPVADLWVDFIEIEPIVGSKE